MKRYIVKIEGEDGREYETLKEALADAGRYVSSYIEEVEVSPGDERKVGVDGRG